MCNSAWRMQNLWNALAAGTGIKVYRLRSTGGLHFRIFLPRNFTKDGLRGLTETFHHVSEEHLNRYVDEFAFRYNRRGTGGKSH